MFVNMLQHANNVYCVITKNKNYRNSVSKNSWKVSFPFADIIQYFTIITFLIQHLKQYLQVIDQYYNLMILYKNNHV